MMWKNYISFKKLCLLTSQFSSVAHSCPTLCDPMNRSTPGLTVHHQLREFTQTHVHRVGDAIQPSYPLSSRFPALSLSQHQGHFQWAGSSYQVAKSIGASALVSVLPMNIQGWFHLGLIGLISLQSEGLSGVFSSTTQLKSIAQPSLWSNSHICIWQLGKPELWLYGPLSQSNVFAFWYAVQVCHSFSSKGQVS